MASLRTASLSPEPPVGARGFIPALEGMRACAAVAVMITHIAFQTAQVGDSVLGRVWGRFDMAVALFFGLSGFLLWRAHARAAWQEGKSPETGRYLRSRLVRIMPAYLVVVLVVLTLMPQARGAEAGTWFANLTLTQVFVPYALIQGLTQMWSLSVEVAFYLLLPVFALALRRLRGRSARKRIPVLTALAVAALSWAWLGSLIPLPGGVNYHNWLPAYLPWFAAGMVLAEVAVAPPARFAAARRWARRRYCWPAAAVVFAVAATPLGGPVTLDTPANWQFAIRMALGAALALLLLAPLVLPAAAQARPGLLGSRTMTALGRWSYGIFIWHLLVLSAIFPLFGIPMFGGHMIKVFVITVIVSAAVSAVSYAWVEEPCRVALARWERARAARIRTRATARQTGTVDQAASSRPSSTSP